MVPTFYKNKLLKFQWLDRMGRCDGPVFVAIRQRRCRMATMGE